VLGGGLMRGRGEVLIPAPAPATFRNDKTFARLREIVQLLACVLVVDDGPHRHRNVFGRAFAARALAAFAVPAAFRLVFRIKAEMQQRIVVFARDKNHIATAPAIAAARSSARNILLAAERQTAIAAVARLHADSYFINKHASSIKDGVRLD
jgi:hypothetical protein